MKNKSFILKLLVVVLFVTVNLSALTISSNDDYKIFKSDKYSIVYTDDHKNEAIFIKENIDEFIKLNDKSFGYSFDEPLNLVLVSNNIQIANAFSTQSPFNLGVYYNGGSGMSDYFATKSWLMTLFTHEMVHNYQINAKKSQISKTLHKYLGNNFMPLWVGPPLFTFPNIFLPTALLEGNAVLNESLYGNGGRLHSGRLNALKNSLVFSDKMDSKRFINDHLFFPYGQEKYIVGGFYMQYLLEVYGLTKVNQFFYEHSVHSINPFWLSQTFKTHFDVTFEQSIVDFNKFTKKRYENYKELKQTNILSTSESEIYLSKQNNKIYFITSDLLTKKELNVFDIKTKANTKSDTTLENGKVFIVDGEQYTATDGFISTTMYKHGLFNENKYVIDDTIGKSVQDIHNGKMAYINIDKSFVNTKLYINGSYYNDISSSALFDDDGNIYYFRQENSNRVLYKNTQKLYEFHSYFSKIVDIVEDDIYFIANTKNGSTLYKLSDNLLYTLNDSDNIINAKIIDNETALVTTITSDKYYLQTINISPKEATIPRNDIVQYNTDFEFKQTNNDTNIQGDNYNELSQLKFSMLYPSISYSSEDSSTYYYLSALFMDPLMFNSLSMYIYRDDEEKTQGISYINDRYIPFRIGIYNIDRVDYYNDNRGYGGSLELYAPLLKTGRNKLNISVTKYFDDKNEYKNPSVFSLEHIYINSFPLEDSLSSLSHTELLYKKDREDIIYGIDYNANKHIGNEFYVNLQVKALDSDIDNLGDQRGIEIVPDIPIESWDSTNVKMESYDDFFVKDIRKFSLGFSQTFHFSHYFSKFPISILKESLFYKYNYYEFTIDKKEKIEENIVGLKLDLLILHKLYLPIIIKYVNDYVYDEQNNQNSNHKVTLSLGIKF